MATWAGPIRITRTGGAAPISFVEGAADACALRGSKRPSRPGGDRRTASRARGYARRTRCSLCANDDDLGDGPRPRLVDRSIDERVVGIARDASHSPSLSTNQTEPDHDPTSPAAADETRTAGTSPVERRRITDAAMALARSDQDLTRLSPGRHLRADV